MALASKRVDPRLRFGHRIEVAACVHLLQLATVGLISLRNQVVDHQALELRELISSDAQTHRNDEVFVIRIFVDWADIESDFALALQTPEEALDADHAGTPAPSSGNHFRILIEDVLVQPTLIDVRNVRPAENEVPQIDQPKESGDEWECEDRKIANHRRAKIDGLRLADADVIKDVMDVKASGHAERLGLHHAADVAGGDRMHRLPFRSERKRRLKTD